jgi:hypothetical protein
MYNSCSNGVALSTKEWGMKKLGGNEFGEMHIAAL